MNFQLIPQVRKWWKLFSVQMMGLSLAIQGAWGAFGDDLKTYIPHAAITAISCVLLFLGIGGRLVVQPKITQDPPPGGQ
jgi:hypothetical protein